MVDTDFYLLLQKLINQMAYSCDANTTWSKIKLIDTSVQLTTFIHNIHSWKVEKIQSNCLSDVFVDADEILCPRIEYSIILKSCDQYDLLL